MGKQDDFKRTQIRFPPDLYQEIVELAEHSGRSINAEVVHRLRQVIEMTKLADFAAKGSPLDTTRATLEAGIALAVNLASTLRTGLEVAEAKEGGEGNKAGK